MYGHQTQKHKLTTNRELMISVVCFSVDLCILPDKRIII